MIPQPQMSMARILRPWTDYDQTYTGENGLNLLMFSDGGVALDDLQGTDGYKNYRMVSGVSVPIGARVLLWLPRIAPAVSVKGYAWVVMWRLRSLHDFELSKSVGQLKPAHLPIEGMGGHTYFPVPVAAHTVVYNQAEPASTGPAIQNSYPEYFRVQPSFSQPAAPFVPGDAPATPSGALGQGLTPYLGKAGFQVSDFTAQGDEMLLGLYKPSGDNWDFESGNDDRALYTFLAESPYAGAYMMYGVSP